MTKYLFCFLYSRHKPEQEQKKERNLELIKLVFYCDLRIRDKKHEKETRRAGNNKSFLCVVRQCSCRTKIKADEFNELQGSFYILRVRGLECVKTFPGDK